MHDGGLDLAITVRGKTRRVGLVVPSFLAVPSLLADSDLLALVPESLLATGPYPRLTHRQPPLSVPPVDIGVAWHRRRDHDVATMHVVRALVETARSVTRRRR